MVDRAAADRSLVETPLASTSALASALFDAAPMPMWLYDRTTLRVLEVNAYAVSRYGYSREEFLSMRVTDLGTPEDAEHSFRLADEPSTGFRHNAEFRHRWKDGTVRDVMVVTYDVRYAGHAARLVMVDDVTDRIAAEHTRELLVAAIEQLDEVVLLLRPGAEVGAPPQIVFANSAVSRVLGVDPDAVKRSGYHRDATPPEMLHLRDLIAGELDCEAPRRCEISYANPDGTLHRLETSSVPVRAPDGLSVSHWAVVARDVTEQRAMADRSAQAQRLESLGLLAGSIAHDFNNLVHVITGFSELALGQLPARGPSTAYVQQAHEAALRASGLAKQLLAFSRRQSLKSVRLDLRGLLDGLRPVLVRLAGARITVSVHGSDSPMMVCADPTQMEQILLNLVVNARDAQPEGGRVDITMTLVERANVSRAHTLPAAADAARWICLRVTDTGPGMTEDVRARVFEPFFTTKAQGTGLGLSTVHGIVRQSGGTIHLESPPSGGLCVEIMLPEA